MPAQWAPTVVVCKTSPMGLFSKRRTAGFDSELWSDADERAKRRGAESWFEDLDADESVLDDLETNAGANFADHDAAWLGDDPGDRIRGDRRRRDR